MADTAEESRRKLLMKELSEGRSGDMTTQQLVELLLLYSVPMKDTEEIAARLFDYFGSMSELMDAEIIELTHMEGISRNSAVLLSMIPQISRRIRLDRHLKKKVVGMDEIRAFVPDCFIGRTVEYFLLLCLDKHQRMIRYDFVSKGTVNSSTVDLRKMVHLLLATDAAYAVVAHNHPRGLAYPSNDDLKTTQVILNAFHTIDVRLLDHLIVDARDCYSIANAPPSISSCMKLK